MKKTFKSFATFFLTLVLTMSLCGVFASANEIYDPSPVATATPTQAPKAPPKIKLSSASNVEVKIGRAQDTNIVVKNVGGTTARKFLAQATISGADTPFTVTFLDNSNKENNIHDGSEKTMVLRIDTDKNAKPGTYAVNLSYSYMDDTIEILKEEDTLYVKVGGLYTTPNIIMSDFAVDNETLAPSDNFNLSVNLKNDGLLEAKDVQITLEGLDTEKVNLAQSSENQFFVSIPTGYTKNLTYKFSLSSKIKEGSYPIIFKCTYTDGNNQAYEKSFTYNVKITGSGSGKKSVVTIQSITEPQGIFEIGQTFNVSITIENTSTEDVSDVKVTAASNEPGAVVPKTASAIVVPSLKAGEIKTLQYTFAPTATAKTQNYMINFKVEYDNGEDKVDNLPSIQTVEQYVGVNVTNPKLDKETDEEGKEKVSKPKIMISSYSTDPQIVKAGQNFTLTLEFANTHKTKSIDNIKAVITPTEIAADKKGNTFMPVNGSNTFYIDTIAPKGKNTIELKMYTIPDADPRTYTMTVKFKYQDAEFNEYEEEEIIGITVKQVTKVEVGTINVPETASVGDAININFNIMNTGKAPLNNLTATASGNFDVKNASMYFGTLNKSASGYYDGEIVMTEPGLQQGKMIISYEDEVGEVTEIVKDFTIDVQEMAPPMMLDENGMPIDPNAMNPDGMTPPVSAPIPMKWVIIGGVVALLCAIVGVTVYKKRKKKGPDLDE